MMVARIYIVAALVILLSAAMMVRLWYLQIVDKDFLQDQGDARTIRMERINAHRGMIQDRHGKPLAVSTPVLSLWANPSEVLDGQEDL
ncbi:MAG: penicillin-binding protein 2, partial [Gammaproteobacteria bacterium]|nr:penicillin-binding protein 2 [Gammaproteobacteria bacterium]